MTPQPTQHALSEAQAEAMAKILFPGVMERDAQGEYLYPGSARKVLVTVQAAWSASPGPGMAELIRQAMDTRAPDYADVGYPGWHGRASDALAALQPVEGGGVDAVGIPATEQNQGLMASRELSPAGGTALDGEG